MHRWIDIWVIVTLFLAVIAINLEKIDNPRQWVIHAINVLAIAEMILVTAGVFFIIHMA